MNRNLVGRCGLYCGLCPIYRAYKDSEKLQKEFAKLHECKAEDVKCEGCQTSRVKGWSGEKMWGKNCPISKCLDAKRLSYCYECAEHSHCERYGKFAGENLELGIDVRRGLQMIKEGKVEEWLQEQDRKWRCPQCGNPIIVSTVIDHCHWCGHKLQARNI